MLNYPKKSAKERRTDNINSRIEATQLINPITSKPYLDNKYPKFPKLRRLEDPIQAHLRTMEERNPSANEHKQGFFKSIGDRLSLIGRALQYREYFHIFKVTDRYNNKKPISLIKKDNLENIIKNYDFDKKIIDLYKIK